MSETPADELVAAFWQHAKTKMRDFGLETVTGQSDGSSLQPAAWFFDGPRAAEDTEAILSGRRTVLTTVVTEEKPEVSDMTILCDPRGVPVALLSTVAVEIVTFGSAGEDLARADGAASLAQWKRSIAEDYRSRTGAEIGDDQEILVETIRVIFS